MKSRVLRRLREKSWRDLRYCFFVGIDVSKGVLDVTIRGDVDLFKQRRFENMPAGFMDLVSWCSRFAPLDAVHFCMESTGPYSWGIASHLADAGLLVSVENPRLIKAHGVSERFQNKTDKADSAVICDYCKAKAPRPWTLTDVRLRELHLLVERLGDVERALLREQNKLEDAYLPPRVLASICRSIKERQNEAELVVQDIEACIAAREDLSPMVRALVKEPGVGERTAMRFLCHVRWGVEGFEGAQQAAAAAGFNPVLVESGNFRGRTRISRRGDPGIRATMYMATLTAIVHNPRVRAFYQTLIAKGKHKKAAIVACARKLLMILFGILKAHIQGQEPVYSGEKQRYLDLRTRQRPFETQRKCAQPLTI